MPLESGQHEEKTMEFDLASSPMTSINTAIMTALDAAGIRTGRIDQNASDAVVVFTPTDRLETGIAMLTVHEILKGMDVAVVSTDQDPDLTIRIVFARAADGSITPPVAKEEHDAVLDDWFVATNGATSRVVGGVRGDSKNRWPDGTTICTSPLQNGTQVGEGRVVHTLRTAYLLGRRKPDSEIDRADVIKCILIGHTPVGMPTRH
jgi:hypothetical protein